MSKTLNIEPTVVAACVELHYEGEWIVLADDNKTRVQIHLKASDVEFLARSAVRAIRAERDRHARMLASVGQEASA